MRYDRFSKLPFVIRTFCFQNNGWIVGGAAAYLMGVSDKEPRDWDILIPLENWDKASKSFPVGSVTNSFGGIKMYMNGVEIDVWGDSLSNFMLSQNRWPNYAVNLNGFVSVTMEKGTS